ncbi:hypothetical protein C8J56DRAFT_881397 [Mycena floridula]|nr:hypothetical protein C8J56DRAFT_881397 [Mycena floridula]
MTKSKPKTDKDPKPRFAKTEEENIRIGALIKPYILAKDEGKDVEFLKREGQICLKHWAFLQDLYPGRELQSLSDAERAHLELTESEELEGMSDAAVRGGTYLNRVLDILDPTATRALQENEIWSTTFQTEKERKELSDILAKHPGGGRAGARKRLEISKEFRQAGIARLNVTDRARLTKLHLEGKQTAAKQREQRKAEQEAQRVVPLEGEMREGFLKELPSICADFLMFLGIKGGMQLTMVIGTFDNAGKKYVRGLHQGLNRQGQSFMESHPNFSQGVIGPFRDFVSESFHDDISPPEVKDSMASDVEGVRFNMGQDGDDEEMVKQSVGLNEVALETRLDGAEAKEEMNFIPVPIENQSYPGLYDRTTPSVFQDASTRGDMPQFTQLHRMPMPEYDEEPVQKLSYYQDPALNQLQQFQPSPSSQQHLTFSPAGQQFQLVPAAFVQEQCQGLPAFQQQVYPSPPSSQGQQEALPIDLQGQYAPSFNQRVFQQPYQQQQFIQPYEQQQFIQPYKQQQFIQLYEQQQLNQQHEQQQFLSQQQSQMLPVEQQRTNLSHFHQGQQHLSPIQQQQIAPASLTPQSLEQEPRHQISGQQPVTSPNSAASAQESPSLTAKKDEPANNAPATNESHVEKKKRKTMEEREDRPGPIDVDVGDKARGRGQRVKKRASALDDPLNDAVNVQWGGKPKKVDPGEVKAEKARKSTAATGGSKGRKKYVTATSDTSTWRRPGFKPANVWKNLVGIARDAIDMKTGKGPETVRVENTPTAVPTVTTYVGPSGVGISGPYCQAWGRDELTGQAGVTGTEEDVLPWRCGNKGSEVSGVKERDSRLDSKDKERVEAEKWVRAGHAT